MNKLDIETRQSWLLHIGSTTYPTFNEFLKFLVARCNALETCDQSIKEVNSNKTKHTQSYAVTTATNSSSASVTCAICLQEHRILECSQFKDKNLSDRRELVKTKRLCYNCLNPSHPVIACKSRFRCLKCNRKHHTLLHDEVQSNHIIADLDDISTSSTNALPTETNSINIHHTSLSTHSLGQSILPTAMIYIADSRGINHKFRALLDSGSQCSFISESCVKQLQLKRTHARIFVDGLATKGLITNGRSEITVSSIYKSANVLKIQSLILNKLTSLLPSIPINRETLSLISGIELADPSFDQPGKIDIIIGADHFFEILTNGQIRALEGSLLAQNTIFGWVISGRTPSTGGSTSNFHLNVDVDKTLRQFFELEEIPSTQLLNLAEQEAELHYKSTYLHQAE